MNSTTSTSTPGACTVLLLRSTFVASLLADREDPADEDRLYVCVVPEALALSWSTTIEHAVNEALNADVAELRETDAESLPARRMPSPSDYTPLAIFEGHPNVIAWF